MKLYEFDEKRFSKYAVIYANSEAQATRFYLSNVYGAKIKFDVPRPLDIDDFWGIFKKRHGDLNMFELKARFASCCTDIFTENTPKRVM